MTQPATMIVYACPVGELAQQLERYMHQSQLACGPNAAHRYMPHCTLTGFFEDQLSALPRYLDALHAARERAWPTRPAQPVTVLGMELRESFHGLLLDAPWLKTLIVDFAARAESPTRVGHLRLKEWLHLSLAYEFQPDHADHLAQLARRLVQPHAPANWELRFYQRLPDWQWQLHRSWPL